jgi:hypothetical protein
LAPKNDLRVEKILLLPAGSPEEYLSFRIMTAASILERINRKPFRPFGNETIGGSWVDVDRETDVLIYERKKPVRLVVLDPNGRMYIFEPEQISAIEAKLNCCYLPFP